MPDTSPPHNGSSDDGLRADGPIAPYHRMSSLRLALRPYQLVAIYKILLVGWRRESIDGFLL